MVRVRRPSGNGNNKINCEHPVGQSDLRSCGSLGNAGGNNGEVEPLAGAAGPNCDFRNPVLQPISKRYGSVGHCDWLSSCHSRCHRHIDIAAKNGQLTVSAGDASNREEENRQGKSSGKRSHDYWFWTVNVIVCGSVPVPWEARASAVYCRMQFPELLPIFRRKSAGTVERVT